MLTIKHVETCLKKKVFNKITFYTLQQIIGSLSCLYFWVPVDLYTSGFIYVLNFSTVHLHFFSLIKFSNIV